MPPPHPSRPSAVPPSPQGEGKGRAGSRPRPASSRPKSRRFAAVGLETRLRAQSWPFGPIHLLAPHAKRLPPSRGKLSADRLTDEGNHGGAGRSFPPPPHPALRATFPPVGGRQRTRRLGAPYMVRTTRRGRWSLPLLSRFARHFPLTGGIGPIGPRAATWGRPYKKSGPFLPVGADLCVRPPLLGAQCAPTAGASPRPTGARQGCPAPSSGSSVSQSSRNSVIMAQ